MYQLLTSSKPTRIALYSFGKPAAFMKAAKEVGLIEDMNKEIAEVFFRLQLGGYILG